MIKSEGLAGLTHESDGGLNSVSIEEFVFSCLFQKQIQLRSLQK